jgi:hypothetical protein
MMLFGDKDSQSTELTIKGVKLTLVEPSALALTRHYDRTSDKSKEASSIEDNGSFRKTVLFTEINLDLVAICLRDQYPSVSHIEIYESLCNEITQYDDIMKLTKAAEEVCNVKFQGSDTQDGNSQED